MNLLIVKFLVKVSLSLFIPLLSLEKVEEDDDFEPVEAVV
jgi:hypothetical protein